MKKKKKRFFRKKRNRRKMNKFSRAPLFRRKSKTPQIRPTSLRSRGRIRTSTSQRNIFAKTDSVFC